MDFPGELAWNASICLYELLSLGGRRAGWWRTHRALRRRFRGLDFDRMAQEVQGATPESLAYGETPVSSLMHLLKHSGLSPGSRFVDLGSGRGLTVFTACLAGFVASGLEFFPESVERARLAAADLGLEVDFTVGDFLETPWPAGDLYYLASSAFGEGTRQRLGTRLAGELPPGTLVITLDWVLEPTDFEGLHTLPIPVTWGVARSFTWRRRGSEPAPSGDVPGEPR